MEDERERAEEIIGWREKEKEREKEREREGEREHIRVAGNYFPFLRFLYALHYSLTEEERSSIFNLTILKIITTSRLMSFLPSTDSSY